MYSFWTTKYALGGILLCCAALAGCDNMIQEVDVAPSSFPPKLAVSATIDTDSGAFNLCFTEMRSLGSYKTWKSEYRTIICKGVVSLYEDDNPTPLYRIVDGDNGQGFDMSLRPSVSGFFIEKKGLPLKAGSAYRLTLEIEGYPTASATVVMPTPPAVEDIALDTGQKIRKRYPYFIGRTGGQEVEGRMDFYPLNLRLTDGSRDRDYYMFRLEATTVRPYYDSYVIPYSIAIANSALIQDNPDMEAEQQLGNNMSDVFLFERMLLSDVSFANATGAIELLLQEEAVKAVAPLPCSQQLEHTSIAIYISHLSQVAYEHHRSLALQRNEIGFFVEPVPIVSNIENGYGCFAAFSTVRKTVYEYYTCASDISYLEY
ncbi:MAG: DUF4249 domain-containing protein [Prevotellaceae bacterium]|jgi:hypothetical protein|nr:DUF4249 domain-containing protein [Prevotellaceae bacterium]